MDPIMTQQDIDSFAKKCEAEMPKHNVTVPLRFGMWEAESWSLMLICCKKVRKASDEDMLNDTETALMNLGLSEDDIYYGGYGSKEGGYVWIVSHPDMPQCVKDRLVREDAEEEAAEEERQRLEYEAAQKQQAEETARLIRDLAAGKLKSSTADGFLVLAGEFYDAIESGEKTVETREFSAYNLKRTIGLTSIRLQRGYGHPGKPPKKMRYEVTKVTLEDEDERECDPYKVPKGFVPAYINLYLGKRLD